MTELKIKRYDAAEFLEHEDDVIAYLNAAFADGHPEVVAHAIGNVARARGMSGIAKECGLGRESLYKALSNKGNPELGTILKVLKALGIRLRAESDTDAPPTA